MIAIGIDTGVHTGFAAWDTEQQAFLDLKTTSITQAMELVKMYEYQHGHDGIELFIEDARKRTWFGSSGPEKQQGAGSIKRDSRIWDDWCKENELAYRMIAPRCNATKLSSLQFKTITKYYGSTSEHARDAAMMVFRK